MKKSDQFELVAQARQVFEEASKRYEGLLSNLDETESVRTTSLAITISDSLKNLNRKVNAFQVGNIDLNKLMDEFIFEEEMISGELEIQTNSHVQLKRFAKRLLQSIKDFISKTGGKKRKVRDVVVNQYSSKQKSKAIAYLLWFFGGFGTLGLHRFYLGRIGTGIGWLFTGGAFFLGAAYDLFALSGMVDDQNYMNQLREVKLKSLSDKNTSQ
ncbi:MAG: TM2 domain-containing protein [Balneolaceae bacterium]|nr:TM2 domain-containing protein [Balneolaceae bacterium]MBO6546015.1 TM2 domain-containing protein [Balneolaceae bacterium]MBO6647411.1 TM2 domain-containing protein [Balneolaceae bacterium]